MHLGIPITDVLEVLKKLIEKGDDLYLFKLIADGDYTDARELFKHALVWKRNEIANFLLNHCEYDAGAEDKLRELIDSQDYETAEDIANLFESYQDNLRKLVG